MANEGLGWDSLLKMVHNPGGDWNPGWGVDLNWLVVEPTHLKNMIVKMGSSSPRFGVKIPNIFELPPPSIVYLPSRERSHIPPWDRKIIDSKVPAIGGDRKIFLKPRQQLFLHWEFKQDYQTTRVASTNKKGRKIIRVWAGSAEDISESCVFFSLKQLADLVNLRAEFIISGLVHFKEKSHFPKLHVKKTKLNYPPQN